jgi:hypothetical protein
MTNPPVQINFHEQLGFLSGFDFSRLFRPLPFLITMVGAVGLHLAARKWTAAPGQHTSSLRAPALLILAVVRAMGLLAWQSFDVKLQTFKGAIAGECFVCLYGHPDLGHLVESNKGLPPFRIATVATARQRPAYAWTYGLETADGYINLYPQRYKQFWEQVVSPLTASDEAVYNSLHYWGSQTYLFSPSGGFPEDEKVSFQGYYDLELLSLANVKYIISALPIQDDNLALLPPKVDNKESGKQNQRRLASPLDRLRGQRARRPLYIYENQRVLPRFFLARHSRLFDEPSQALAALGRASYSDLGSIAYITQGDAEGLAVGQLGGLGGTVSLRNYSSSRITLDVRAYSSAILVVANTYSPYWKVWIDHIQTRVFPVNHTFQGVYVDAGQHEITLEYAPPYAIGLGR